MEFMEVESGALGWPVSRSLGAAGEGPPVLGQGGLQEPPGAGLQKRGRQEAVLVSPDHEG